MIGRLNLCRERKRVVKGGFLLRPVRNINSIIAKRCSISLCYSTTLTRSLHLPQAAVAARFLLPPALVFKSSPTKNRYPKWYLFFWRRRRDFSLREPGYNINSLLAKNAPIRCVVAPCRTPFVVHRTRSLRPVCNINSIIAKCCSISLCYSTTLTRSLHLPQAAVAARFLLPPALVFKSPRNQKSKPQK